MIPPADVADLLAAVPLGTSRGIAHGKPYVASRSIFNNGRSTKLVAEELGGAGYVSMNLYELKSGFRLYPCEMPVARVIDFLRSYRVVPSDG